jgi:hypothetical protein
LPLSEGFDPQKAIFQLAQAYKIIIVIKQAVIFKNNSPFYNSLKLPEGIKKPSQREL